MSSGSIYDSKESRFFSALVRRRDNEFYRRGQAIRYACQLDEEGIHHYDEIENGGWDAKRVWLARRKERYKLFPQPSMMIVVWKGGTLLLPVTSDTRAEQLASWIKMIPEGKRVGGTRGFGGQFAGAAPKKKEKGRYYRFGYSLESVKNLLFISGVKYKEDRLGNVYISGMTKEDALEYTVSSFAKMLQ